MPKRMNTKGDFTVNLILTGPSGRGKSTALRRVLAQLGEPVCGFWTEKLIRGVPSPVFLHDCRAPLRYTPEQIVGAPKDGYMAAFPATFDTLGAASLRDLPQNAVVLMDELGFLESKAPVFQAAVISVLDSGRRVLAAIGDRDTPFLNAVRMHRSCVCIDAAQARSDGFIALALDLLSCANGKK